MPHTARNSNFAPFGRVQSCLQQYYKFPFEKSEGINPLKSSQKSSFSPVLQMNKDALKENFL